MPTTRRSILLIDDDEQNLSVLTEFLSARFEVQSQSNPRLGVEAAIQSHPSLIVCDINMPGMNGFEVCEAIRAALPEQGVAQLPFVFLTSDPQASSMQRALAIGGSDYLIKPIRLMELMSRIELRLGLSHADALTKSGNLSLDPAQGTARIKKRGKVVEIRLTERAFRVLEVLMRNEGRMLSREQLLNEAWGGKSGGEEGASDRAVDLHVFRLRRLLAGWDREIQTVYGRGYCVAGRASGKAISRASKPAK
jgi:DNA-binding response OmpR family regulator